MENENREYKLILTDDIEKEIVGFLNTSGGELLIGLDDNGIIVGLSNADADALALADRIKNNILPSAMGLFSISLKENMGKRYISVVVAGGFEKPYYLKKFGMSQKGCYIRIGSQTSPMEQSNIDSFYSRRVLNTLHNVVSPRQNLTFSQLKIFYEEKGFNIGEFFLENLDLYTDDGKFNYAAYLMADSNATSIMVAKFAGKDKIVIQSKKDYGGCCLIKTAYNVLDALNIYNQTAVEIKYPNRIETSLIEPSALREVALNAIIHNDYINGTDPAFEVYDDRIEIISSGGLPSGLSQDEFFQGRSLPRNREIMRIFRDMDLGERLGSGMQRIMKAYTKNDFAISANFLSAIFKFDKKALNLTKKEKSKPLTQQNDPVNNKNEVVNDKNEVVNPKNEVANPKNDLVNKQFDLVNKKNDLVNPKNDLVNDKKDPLNPKNDLVNKQFDLVNKKNDLVNKKIDLVNDKNEVVKKKNDPVNKHFDLVNDKNDPLNPKNDLVNDLVNLSDTAKLVMQTIIKLPTASYKEISSTISISEATVKRAIKELKDKKMIRRVGSDKSGYWEAIN